MITKVSHGSIYVNDIDEALTYYTDVLGFKKISDAPMNEDGDRWVTVAAEDGNFEVILQDPKWGMEMSEEAIAQRMSQVGKQAGFILVTDDINAEVERLKSKSVNFTMEATNMVWGIQAAFEDLYGNVHLLHQDHPHH